jgi:hypothetical protein
MDAIAALIAERDKTHGPWRETARVTQELKRVIEKNLRGNISFEQLEALDMIAHKLARIVVGDAGHADHWTDLQGYAALGSPDREPGEGRPKNVCSHGYRLDVRECHGDPSQFAHPLKIGDGA